MREKEMSTRVLPFQSQFLRYEVPKLTLQTNAMHGKSTRGKGKPAMAWRETRTENSRRVSGKIICQQVVALSFSRLTSRGLTTETTSWLATYFEFRSRLKPSASFSVAH